MDRINKSKMNKEKREEKKINTFLKRTSSKKYEYKEVVKDRKFWETRLRKLTMKLRQTRRESAKLNINSWIWECNQELDKIKKGGM